VENKNRKLGYRLTMWCQLSGEVLLGFGIFNLYVSVVTDKKGEPLLTIEAYDSKKICQSGTETYEPRSVLDFHGIRVVQLPNVDTCRKDVRSCGTPETYTPR
jgi:hypothetical protein